MKRKNPFPPPAAEGQSKIQIHAMSRTFSGPLPPPEFLERYNGAAPGAAERILAMAESQQQHRQAIEKSVIDANNRDQVLGSVFGFIVAMTAILGGIYLIALGRSASGLVSILAALISLVGVFVYGKISQKQELEDKSRAITTRTH